MFGEKEGAYKFVFEQKSYKLKELVSLNPFTRFSTLNKLSHEEFYQLPC